MWIERMTQDDVDEGKAIAEVGFAPPGPAEFVVMRGQPVSDR